MCAYIAQKIIDNINKQIQQMKMVIMSCSNDCILQGSVVTYLP